MCKKNIAATMPAIIIATRFFVLKMLDGLNMISLVTTTRVTTNAGMNVENPIAVLSDTKMMQVGKLILSDRYMYSKNIIIYDAEISNA